MVSLCVCIGWIGEWLHFPGSPNKTKVLCVCFGVLYVFTLLLNNTTNLISDTPPSQHLLTNNLCVTKGKPSPYRSIGSRPSGLGQATSGPEPL